MVVEVPEDSVNNMVVVVDSQSPRFVWLLGRRTEVLPGSDGHVRVTRMLTCFDLFFPVMFCNRSIWERWGCRTFAKYSPPLAPSIAYRLNASYSMRSLCIFCLFFCLFIVPFRRRGEHSAVSCLRLVDYVLVYLYDSVLNITLDYNIIV